MDQSQTKKCNKSSSCSEAERPAISCIGRTKSSRRERYRVKKGRPLSESGCIVASISGFSLPFSLSLCLSLLPSLSPASRVWSIRGSVDVAACQWSKCFTRYLSLRVCWPSSSSVSVVGFFYSFFVSFFLFLLFAFIALGRYLWQQQPYH